MYPSSPYGNNYGMQNNQPVNDDPNQQEQQSFAEHLRTCISGLSALTGISYGFASLFRVFVKTLKFFNIFKGKKATNQLLSTVWRASSSRQSVFSRIKFFLLAFLVITQFAIFAFIHKKKERLYLQAMKEQEEEQKLVQSEQLRSIHDVHFDDFTFTKSDHVSEDELETNDTGDESVKLSSVKDLNN
mmetsp:Transcript_24925/g.28619  ORF Transcript_24925/g.28619 Transcript_24925/m.28619 type:complete len:187 (+) Transcript_24925:29-589(+)